jgi:hypothetical protein
MRNLWLLDRLLILVVAILAVAALVGLIKFDMRRTAASPPAIHGALGGQLWLREGDGYPDAASNTAT